MDLNNPFSSSKASDYTDEQINSFWTEMDPEFLNSVIEPNSTKSSFILGGKGSGKTHILRHHSYFSTKLREVNLSPIEIALKYKFIGVFIRANGLDAAKFKSIDGENESLWQKLFGLSFELKILDALLEILNDIENLSGESENFDLNGFFQNLLCDNFDIKAINFLSLAEFRLWVKQTSKSINSLVNDYAFTRKLDFKVPFELGSLLFNLKKAIKAWNSNVGKVNFLFLIDEVENLKLISHQEVLQTFIRYGEGSVTFRISGRRYALKTYNTIGGEPNRENSEFKKIYLDENLLNLPKYKVFAEKLVHNRLEMAGFLKESKKFKIDQVFEEVNDKNFYEEFLNSYLGEKKNTYDAFKNFERALLNSEQKDLDSLKINCIVCYLKGNFPLLIQKHNILMFIKKWKKNTNLIELSADINTKANNFINGKSDDKSYHTSLSHWKNDLLAQIFKDNNKPVVYAGFDNFIKMSSNNTRNLLTILSNIYDLAYFNRIDILAGSRVSIKIQSEGVYNTAKYMSEYDASYGYVSEEARNSIYKLATLLRTARFSLNIPEVSPLYISFDENKLSDRSKTIIQNALNYSFLLEFNDGRSDRNSKSIKRKLFLNPMLSPRWELPISRRGDLSLNVNMVEAIFVPEKDDFDRLLSETNAKWNKLKIKNNSRKVRNSASIEKDSFDESSTSPQLNLFLQS